MEKRRRLVYLDGKTMSVQQLADLFGVSYHAAWHAAISKGYQGDKLKEWLSSVDKRNPHPESALKLWCYEYCTRCEYRKTIESSARPNRDWSNTYCSCYPETRITPTRGTHSFDCFKPRKRVAKYDR